MGKINIDTLIRKNILNLNPYSSARDEFQGDASVFLDANENPYNSPLNRYPDPHQKKLKKKISELIGLNDDLIFLGNGSDEAIDLIIRTFCEPGRDNIISIDPSYGMYEVCANINNVEFRKVLLNQDFSLDTESILAATDERSRIIFLCSPNNPSSNLLNYEKIIKLITSFWGLVVIDEAYIDFSATPGMLPDLKNYNNLVILRTFSKAWGLAGIRLGMAFADKKIVAHLDRIKYPYNINFLTQEVMLEKLKSTEFKDKSVALILSEREKLKLRLIEFPFVIKVYPSDANFLLVKMINAAKIYHFLKGRGIIVRDRSKINLCEDCLRLTVGTPEENALLINSLNLFK